MIAKTWAAWAIVVAMTTGALTLPALGQEAGAPPAEAPAEAAPEPAPAEAAPDAAAAEPAPAEEAAPAEPAGPTFAPELTDPATSLEELTIRLIPLTADELAALAAEWLGIVRAKTEEVVAEQVRVLGTEGAVEDAAREELTRLTEERRILFDHYSTVIAAWEAKGGDAAAIANYRAYRSSIIVEETRTSDWRTLLSRAAAWAQSPDGGIRLATRIAIIGASFVGLILVARVVRRIARRVFGRVPNLSKLLQGFLALVVYWLTIAFGLMVVLSALGVNVTPLFALVGGASFILAFAMQDTLSNLAAGLMIMINHPFDEGDSVDIAGVAGTVKTVSIVSTTVMTPDNQVIVVPNSKVWGNVIKNSTASETRRVDLTFGVSRGEPIAKVQGVLEETVKAHPLVLASPAPTIQVSELTDGAIKFAVQPWAKLGDLGTVQSDLLRQVKEAFERAEITAA